MRLVAHFVNQVSEIANDLIDDKWEITQFQALKLAVEIQRNRILSLGLAVYEDEASALEAVAIQLGHSNPRETGTTIKEALFEIANNLDKD